MNKRLKLIEKVYFFEKNNPFSFGNDWGIKLDWARYIDDKNPKNAYPFINELIEKEVLVFDKYVIRTNKKEEKKYKLNKKISLLMAGYRYRTILKKMAKDLEEFKFFRKIFEIIVE